LTETIRRLKHVLSEVAITQLAELRSEPIQRWIGRRRQVCSAEKNGAKTTGPRTINTYLSSLKAFVRWCITDGRMATDPLVTLRKVDESGDVRRARRSLTEDELVKLLEVAERRPLLDSMMIRRGRRAGETVGKLKEPTREKLERLGRERRLIYMTLVLTGLRKGELTQLRWTDLDLEANQAWLTVRAAVSKNGKTETLPIRADLSGELKAWQRENGHPAGTGNVFRVPRGLVRIMDRDLVAAGIARRVRDENGVYRIDKRDDQGRTIDVHALRHTTATFLARSGVAPRTAQSIMRHSDVRLTLGTYTDPRLLDTAKAVDALPKMTPKPDAQRMRATGTFGKGDSELGAELGVKARPAMRRRARTRIDAASQPRKPRKVQPAVDARVSTDLHDHASQRATRLERATFSLEG